MVFVMHSKQRLVIRKTSYPLDRLVTFVGQMSVIQTWWYPHLLCICLIISQAETKALGIPSFLNNKLFCNGKQAIGTHWWPWHETAAIWAEALRIIIPRYHSKQHEIKSHKQLTLQTQYNNGWCDTLQSTGVLQCLHWKPWFEYRYRRCKVCS